MLALFIYCFKLFALILVLFVLQKGLVNFLSAVRKNNVRQVSSPLSSEKLEDGGKSAVTSPDFDRKTHCVDCGNGLACSKCGNSHWEFEQMTDKQIKDIQQREDQLRQSNRLDEVIFLVIFLFILFV